MRSFHLISHRLHPWFLASISIDELKLISLGFQPFVDDTVVSKLFLSAFDSARDPPFTSVHPFDALGDGDHDVLVSLHQCVDVPEERLDLVGELPEISFEFGYGLMDEIAVVLRWLGSLEAL